MTTLIPFERELWRNFERLFDQTSAPVASVPFDLFETEEALFVRASLPGVRQEDVKVSLEGRVLTLTAEAPALPENAKIYRRDLPTGKLSVSLRVPQGFDGDNIQATLTSGLMTVRIPRREPIRPEVRDIPIQAE